MRKSALYRLSLIHAYEYFRASSRRDGIVARLDGNTGKIPGEKRLVLRGRTTERRTGVEIAVEKHAGEAASGREERLYLSGIGFPVYRIDRAEKRLLEDEIVLSFVGEKIRFQYLCFREVGCIGAQHAQRIFDEIHCKYILKSQPVSVDRLESLSAAGNQYLQVFVFQLIQVFF